MRIAIYTTVTAAAMACALCVPGAARATPLSADEAAAIRSEMAAMRQRIAELEAKLNTQAADIASTRTAADAAAANAMAAHTRAADAAKAAGKTRVAWKGGPELSTDDGWSFKPRGRLQVDVAGVNAPSGINSNKSLGIGSEFRRLYLGVDGAMPGGFKYRLEADFANSAVELTDAYLSWTSKNVTVTAGQMKPFWGLEELTSDLFTTNMERAAFAQAFGFERRVGLAAQYMSTDFLIQGGIFGDHANDLLRDANNSNSFDGRVVYFPRLGDTQFHVGGSIHSRKFRDQAATTRYRARPFSHVTDVRLVDTKDFSATGELGYGAELAAIHGPLHAAGEVFWQSAQRPGLANPRFFGAYGEVGYMVTGESRGYKSGIFDRTRPENPVGSGGIGAIEANLRYDWLDLNDAAIIGGRQRIYSASLIWVPTDYTRFILDYGHVVLRDSPVTGAAGDADYNADTVGLRAQFDF